MDSDYELLIRRNLDEDIHILKADYMRLADFPLLRIDLSGSVTISDRERHTFVNFGFAQM